MKKEDKELVKLDKAHEIQQIFLYHFHDDWADQSFINQHDRLWIQTFNELVKQGLIEKKKTTSGYIYRWAARFPDI